LSTPPAGSAPHAGLTGPVRIIGGGPTGALMAILLNDRGLGPVELYESRPDPRRRPAESGRSINLALADRGIHALKRAGIFDDLGASLLPMRGRMIHARDGGTVFQPYGQRPREVIYSVSRHRLNQALIGIAAARAGVRMHFEHRLDSVDFANGTALIRDLQARRSLEVPMQPLLATDGAGSVVRRALGAAHFAVSHESDLDHGYKELSIPADAGAHRLAADALHIWPRGSHMLIALPNDDGSFTATLFMRKHGADSFESLRDGPHVEQFLRREFPDVCDLVPDRVAQYAAHPVGFLGSVSVSPWHHGGMVTLLGDAAHAIVPFHGQGMNCCFEDCIALDDCLARHSSWDAAFAEFGAARKPDTDAIAAMSLDNYLEMREQVAHPRFQLQQALALELERRFPRRFVPRYSMVTFHHEIPYRTALTRGRIQAQILDELTRGEVHSVSDVDFERAAAEIESRLPPV
jgi:kynurenine 3-monooxygenase